MTNKNPPPTKRQLIAVDIDEVLAHHNQALAEWHNGEFGTNHGAEAYFTDYWSKVWGVSPEEADRRALAFHASGAHARLRSITGAFEILQQLRASYDLAIVTVRRQSTIEDTRQWVNRHYPNIFTEIHFVHFWDDNDTTTKAQLCQRIGAHYLIDDSVKHCALAAQAGMQALLFGDYAWNKAEKLPERIKRVAEWNEVLKVLRTDKPQKSINTILGGGQI